MSRILIAGCGYVGQATADLFHERGWDVEGWTGSAQSARELSSTKPYPVRASDISAARSTSSAQQFDVIIQCASSGGGDAVQYRRVYLEGVRHLIAAFPDALLVLTSSTSMYAQRNGEKVDENSLANPMHEKGKVLREAEELVLAHRGIVARLGGIYGPNRSHFLQKFLAGEAIIEDDHFINQAHRDDIAAALFLMVDRRNEIGSGRIYNVVDDEPVLARDVLEWLSALLNRPLPLEGKIVARRKRGESNKRVSNKKLRALGWEPHYPTFRKGMTESVLPSFGFPA